MIADYYSKWKEKTKDLLKHKKELYNNIFDFINDDQCDNIDEKSCNQNYFNFFKNLFFFDDSQELKEFLCLLIKISKNHNRKNNLIKKIKNLIHFFSSSIKNQLSDQELYDLFQNNKLLLLFILEKDILRMNEDIARKLLNKKSPNGTSFCIFFYPEIQEFISEEERERIKSNFADLQQENLNEFEQKRHKGENDAHICELIQNDSVDEFIAYINRVNFSLRKKIEPSEYETNPFLLKKTPSIIEYAAFYGSIQVYQFLVFNKVKLNPSLYAYAVHGDNPELLHDIESKSVELTKQTYFSVLKESIKCHSNNFSDYIINTMINQVKKSNYDDDDDDDDYDNNNNNNNNSDKKDELLLSDTNRTYEYAFHYHNYALFPDDINDKFLFLFACKYNYMNIVQFFLKSEEFNRDELIVIFFFIN